MSFGTFWGTDPTNLGTYQKVLPKYLPPAGGGGAVNSVSATPLANITVNNADPANPTIGVINPLNAVLNINDQNITGTTAQIVLTDAGVPASVADLRAGILTFTDTVNPAINSEFTKTAVEFADGANTTSLFAGGIAETQNAVLTIQNNAVGGGIALNTNAGAGTITTNSNLQPFAILDTAGGVRGAAGQVLSSLGAGGGTQWIPMGGGGGGIAAVNAGTNISIPNPAIPVVAIQNPLTAQLNIGTQDIVGTNGFDSTTINANGIDTSYFQAGVASSNADLIGNNAGANLLLSGSNLAAANAHSLQLETPVVGNATIAHTTVGAVARDLGISTQGNMTIVADNIDLTAAGRLTVPSTAAADYLDYNTGTLHLKTDNVGYTTDELLLLENANPTAGNTTGVPSVEFFKSGRNAVLNDVVASVQFNALDVAGTKRTFGKIESTVTNNAAPANFDGSLDFYSLINGVNNLVFRLNGADNENNTFRALDLNGQLLKTSSGDLLIDATSSIGTGSIQMTTKAASQLLITNSGGGNTIIQNSSAGGLASAPIVQLLQNNASGGVVLEVYKNNPAAEPPNSILHILSVYGKDATNAKQEFSRITHKVIDSTGGSEDGAIDFSCFRAGVMEDFLSINGSDGEVQLKKSIDVNGNTILTQFGDIAINTTTSTGAGNISLTAKSAGNITLTTASTGKVSTNQALQAQRILDTAGNSGGLGQVLSSLGGALGTSWINSPPATAPSVNGTPWGYEIAITGSDTVIKSAPAARFDFDQFNAIISDLVVPDPLLYDTNAVMIEVFVNCVIPEGSGLGPIFTPQLPFSTGTGPNGLNDPTPTNPATQLIWHLQYYLAPTSAPITPTPPLQECVTPCFASSPIMTFPILGLTFSPPIGNKFHSSASLTGLIDLTGVPTTNYIFFVLNCYSNDGQIDTQTSTGGTQGAINMRCFPIRHA